MHIQAHAHTAAAWFSTLPKCFYDSFVDMVYRPSSVQAKAAVIMRPLKARGSCQHFPCQNTMWITPARVSGGAATKLSSSRTAPKSIIQKYCCRVWPLQEGGSRLIKKILQWHLYSLLIWCTCHLERRKGCVWKICLVLYILFHLFTFC